jgi:hypothetical protein
MRDFNVLIGIVLAVGISAQVAPAAPLILNEYNAVSKDNFLDGDDSDKTDTFFGRVAGNGGDWFELVVIEDGLDIRGWEVLITDGPEDDRTQGTLTFARDPLWSALAGGTIITVAEDLDDDVSFDPGTDDWWINVRASNEGTGTYISKRNFPVSNDDTQFEIRDQSRTTVFGPSGEGIVIGVGVNSREVFKLEADPSAAIMGDSSDYNDGTSSTFGAPNVWSGASMTQDFSALRGREPTPTPTLTAMADTPTPSAVPDTPTPTATFGPCIGDCDGSGSIGIAELIRGVNIALGLLPLDDCPSMDADDSGSVGIGDLIRAVNSALGLCVPA